MGKILPRKKFFKSAIYSPKLNVGSHIDNVRHSLEHLIFSNERESERSLFKKRIKVVVIVTLLLMIVGSFLSPKGKAEVATFYPTACLGGWNNPRNAEGEPETKSNTDESVFTKDNSALLLATTNADIYCGNFTGQIEQNTKPTKILVALAWSKGPDIVLEQNIVGDSFASSSVEILDSASTTDVSFTLSSSTGAVATSTEGSGSIVSTTSPQTEETSLVSKVVNVVEETFQKMFGGESNSTSTPEEATQVPVEVKTDVPVATQPENTVQEEIKVEVAPTPQPETPPSDSPPVSFLDTFLQKISSHFIKKVFAEEVATTTYTVTIDAQSVPETSTTTSTPQTSEVVIKEPVIIKESTGDATTTEAVASTTPETTEIASTTESTSTQVFLDTTSPVTTDSSSNNESQNNFLEVLYTFDGIVWNSLGKVNEESMKYRTFEIPVNATTSWGVLSQLQIKVQSIQRVDATPTVYLDGIKVEVLYETSVAHEHPDFARDTILKDKSDDGVRVVNIINSDTSANEIWYTTIDIQGEYGVAPGTWVEVRLDQTSSSHKLIDIYGQNIFWVDDKEKLLWVTNLRKETNDGVGVIQDASTTVAFTKTNGEEWVFEYNNTTKAGLARIKN